MTTEFITSLIKLAGAAVFVAIALLFFVIQSRYSLPIAAFVAVIFAVYATGRIARKGLLKLS
ncbi:hypothetical protein [Companilactobacillus mishanensis]|uniref:Uncharacterized protein n=1 Tax=Companilactobacillus mishanensis TaxID=2486008 RepID=A0A5P0ZJL6_9LACO|nr:hypothetical protein [Companilactobacillus mishanensis]MQS45301.1 hypothetical protein [Companilactobacillus mishanensis]MQS53279.1 hypothetical protein [Companilactobacillus mishanensis]MQS90037.1 hypothetical protein [Companilactobacillus mishanensis]